MKNGSWVLLDELNLASQSVLEGLNAILDHRKEVFLPELNETIICHPNFQIFACQNPVQEGGGRKGLPASFLNRFTKVWLSSLTNEDVIHICQSVYPQFSTEMIQLMIKFNSEIFNKTMILHQFGQQGAPWEFNLRDIFRWCNLILKINNNKDNNINISSLSYTWPGLYIDLLYKQRMRNEYV